VFIELLEEVFELRLNVVNELVPFLVVVLRDLGVADGVDPLVAVDASVVLLYLVEDAAVLVDFIIQNVLLTAAALDHFSD
jgi:hypothetical protein